MVSNSGIFSTICLVYILISAKGSSASTHDPLLPHLCDNVKCPPLSEITCPKDSVIRETLQSFALLSDVMVTTPVEEAYNTTQLDDDIYAQCCLAKKCVCKTCYIPDCHNEGEVVIELKPESMETPGLCCGKYECHKEPNCTEIRDTDNFWLTNCQRCRCYTGERICHQSCDEGLKKATAICNSRNLNTFFQHGESWKDGCQECECVNGEEKCVMSFCRSVNCPQHRQVLQKDSCCPICWPAGVPIPNGDENYDDEDSDGVYGESGNRIYDDEDESIPNEVHHVNNGDYGENEIDILPNIRFEKDNNITSTNTEKAKASSAPATSKATSTTTMTSTIKSTTADDEISISNVDNLSSMKTLNEVHADDSTTAPPPCMLNSPATYPEVVEVLRPNESKFYCFIIIIGVLILVIIGLIWWNIKLRTKQRSYRPVSNFDDNFNKMSTNIKKNNDYV